jgi:hypothetical protein
VRTRIITEAAQTSHLWASCCLLLSVFFTFFLACSGGAGLQFLWRVSRWQYFNHRAEVLSESSLFKIYHHKYTTVKDLNPILCSMVNVSNLITNGLPLSSLILSLSNMNIIYIYIHMSSYIFLALLHTAGTF